MAPAGKAQSRSRGEIEQLPSGSLRVRVYAGIDPVSKRRHYLTEVVPAGPKAQKLAEKARTRLLADVDERRNPRTRATVAQLIARHLELLTIEDTTRDRYERLARLHIVPILGPISLSRLDGEVLDSFYRELRRCRAHCDGRARTDHRTTAEHDCDDRCQPHACKPLGASSVHQAHTILNGALGRAVKWRWLGANPAEQAETPSQPGGDPDPPTPEQAAAIVGAAWADPTWGMLVWLAMTTGARRGELCAVRWDRIDFTAGVVVLRSSMAQVNQRVWEKSTKTHQRRRIVLDAQTLALLRAYLQHCATQAAVAGIELPADSFVFSAAPDGAVGLRPDTVTQRYTRMCRRLGWDMHIHQLRHYSATELIAAGVDVRTVAGRLGHGGGGTTTLRVYTAWVAEADQRAAQTLSTRLPVLTTNLAVDAETDASMTLPSLTRADDASPYLRIARDLRGAIRCGALNSGDAIPSVKNLAARYKVSVATAHRAVAALRDAGDVSAARGKRTVVSSSAWNAGGDASGFETLTDPT